MFGRSGRYGIFHLYGIDTNSSVVITADIGYYSVCAGLSYFKCHLNEIVTRHGIVPVYCLNVCICRIVYCRHIVACLVNKPYIGDIAVASGTCSYFKCTRTFKRDGKRTLVYLYAIIGRLYSVYIFLRVSYSRSYECITAVKRFGCELCLILYGRTAKCSLQFFKTERIFVGLTGNNNFFSYGVGNRSVCGHGIALGIRLGIADIGYACRRYRGGGEPFYYHIFGGELLGCAAGIGCGEGPGFADDIGTCGLSYQSA